MADLCGRQAVTLIKSEDVSHDNVLSDVHEHDDVPLKLWTKDRFTGSKLCPDAVIFENGQELDYKAHIDTVVRIKDEACYSQLLQDILALPSGCFPDKEKNDTVVQKQNDTVNVIQGVTSDSAAKSTVPDMCSSPDITLIRPDCLPEDLNGRSLSGAMVCQNQVLSTENNNDICGVEKFTVNVCSLNQHLTHLKLPEKIKIKVLDHNRISLVGEGTGCLSDFDQLRLKQEISSDFMNDDLDHIVLKQRQKMLLSRSVLGKEKSVTEIVMQANPDGIHIPTLSSMVKVKVEESNDLPSIDNNSVKEFPFSNFETVKKFPFSNFEAVKSEWELPERLDGDELDHMPLKYRIKLLTSGGISNSVYSTEYKCCNTRPSNLESNPVFSESIKPVTISRLRKRKRTATDSIETALDEDAPGLLQVLMEKGISVDEIRLYGEPESEDALEDSTDDFADLEAVISKIFFKRQSLLKLAPIRCAKGSKISYCLACLLSLVEQTRYLHFRKWPVEWGWCRELQSFIFVFQRHNRIVLERPEYGYATYFFELIPALPIDWQIKRLVTAMKLTNCSRINLIENKTLLVGEDLSEGEAQVLAGYGWIPDTGLGSMLNYRDRVFHDRNSVKEISEWRSRIGKLLMDGFDGGTIVLTDIPKKVMKYKGGLTQQIKSEL